MKDTIGGYPCDITKEKNETIIRFHPKAANAKNPGMVRFALRLTKEDRAKLAKL